MCPPSNCPIGNRFSMVTNRPIQPAKAIGCSIISCDASSAGCVSHVSNFIKIESPSIIAPWISTLSITSDKSKPMIKAGTAIMKPAIGPAAPICSRASLRYIGDLILINAPKVPIKNKNGGAGIK